MTNHGIFHMYFGQLIFRKGNTDYRWSKLKYIASHNGFAYPGIIFPDESIESHE